jgi:amino acid transporter
VDVWHWLMGRPLKSSQAEHEEITAPQGLAALSLDALTSVAYGPQAIILVLATAGAAALRLLLPVTVVIVALLGLLVLSYCQVIDAYPGGGGAYAVSRENLGPAASLVAAAALICDYVLTVAVSIAAGVAALTSAFPALIPLTVPLGLALLAVITVLNLRGVGEGARAFMLPTLVFIVGLLAILAIGFVHPAHPTGVPAAGAAQAAAAATPVATVGLLLLLRAFAAGCSALTGVEAIANGVPLFLEPRVVRAKRTELALGAILAAMLLGLAVLAVRFHVGPRPDETVLSQVMGAAVGRGAIYYTIALATTATLALAANTSFGGLPVLASILARDNFLPHVFALRGDRLTFQYGIAALALLSAALLLAVGGNTDALIPLFAIGVFTGFTLAQSGLVVHWWRMRPPRWPLRAALNGVGAGATGIATLVFIYTKFGEGAWVVVLAIPLLIVLFRRIRAYYQRVDRVLAAGIIPEPPRRRRTAVVVPVTALSIPTARAVADALSMGDDVLAVTVQFDAEAAHAMEEAWERWNPGVRLVVLQTQYSSIVRPILRFIDTIDRQSHERVVVLIPEVVPRGFWHQLLHNQLGILLAASLRRRADVVVAVAPYHLPWESPPARGLARVWPRRAGGPPKGSPLPPGPGGDGNPGV